MPGCPWVVAVRRFPLQLPRQRSRSLVLPRDIPADDMDGPKVGYKWFNGAQGGGWDFRGGEIAADGSGAPPVIRLAKLAD